MLLTVPGVPFGGGVVLAPQLDASVLSKAGLISSRDGPVPFAAVGHGGKSSYATKSIRTPMLWKTRAVSPPLPRENPSPGVVLSNWFGFRFVTPGYFAWNALVMPGITRYAPAASVPTRKHFGCAESESIRYQPARLCEDGPGL